MSKGIDDLQRAYDAALARLNAAENAVSRLVNGAALGPGDVPNLTEAAHKAAYKELDDAREAFERARKDLDDAS
ncbi:hypothetical protein SAMN05216371_3854 [Streptomyces sp. TLI_053]|uniref:hypothetical protein n=1 Tax=Streptomyces sp. TLI_053 TaxID=1855352 RepID=UPI00087C5498|nr:hypothetical protein [Streptomyces sp. TLI_053]SDT69776.1 hypothetical protein SAMN05216371_3854 [Streptomyces sp. TLI_053]